MSQFNKQFLQQQIAAGNIAGVIQLLSANTTNIPSAALRQEVVHLSSRWHDYERALRMRTTSQEELDLTKRQLDHSLLSLLDSA